MGAGPDQDFFEFADVVYRAELGRERAQIEDGIGDELTGAVEGDVSAAIGLEEFYALAVENFAGSDNVVFFGVAAEGDNGRVLNQEKGVSDATVFAHAYERLLKFQSSRVVEH